MKAYIFFSVHEELFRRIAEGLGAFGVSEFSGFVWGHNQEAAISGHGVTFDPLLIFTRDILLQADDGRPADVEWLAQRERELGISLSRIVASERHLLAGRTHDQIMRLLEVALRVIAEAYDRIKPDFIFSEDVSCLHSYLHFVLAQERKIPYWSIGSGRLPQRVSVYASGMQHLERVEQMYPALLARGLTSEQRSAAEAYMNVFRDRPTRPSGMDVRSRFRAIGLQDLTRLRIVAKRYFGDREDPTMASPLRVIRNRLQRVARQRAAAWHRVFEPPVEGEKYILYPIHYQPEATTLVQAPMYVDQVALIEDMAKCLPIGHRLYVKEHVTNRGRRPLEFYQRLRAIHAVRLLGPDEDTWTLIRKAAAIAVITGTMGWEGLLLDKPVITFGDVFFNMLPQVHRAGAVAKDAWFAVFTAAVTEHRPDREALLALVAALQAASHPGFIGNSTTFPHVLEPENVERLTIALASEAGLSASAQRGSVRPASSSS
jgi:hypothetical protein